MAGMNIGTLIFELTALAPELNDAEELEDIIYSKLQGVADAEKAKIDTETKRLKKVFYAAKGGRPYQDNETLTPGLTVVENETNNLAMKLIALSNKYKGPQAEELRALVRQLPRAAKAERAPAQVEIKRLQAEIAALKATTTAQSPSQTSDLRVAEGSKAVRQDSHQAERTARTQMPQDARPSESPASSLNGQRIYSTPAKAALGADRYKDERERENIRRQAAKNPKTPSAPSAMRNSGGSGIQTRRVSEADQRLARSPISGHRELDMAKNQDPDGSDHHNHKRNFSRSDSHAPAPPSTKRRRTLTTTVECQLICGSCKRYGADCNGMPRCNHCTTFCVYHPCAFGDSCHVSSCTRIHPAQWEAVKEGPGNNVQGLNVHTKAPNMFGNRK